MYWSCYLLFLYKKERAFLLLFLALFKEDIALRFVVGILECWSNYRLVSYLNWHSTLRSFYYSLHVRCLFTWGRALGPFGGLRTGWLNCCLFCIEEKRDDPEVIL